MQKKHRLIIAGIAAIQALSCVAAVSVHAADSRQKNKNFWRNATIASGAVGLYGLAKHKDTIALAGAAGAIYSAQRYEDDRHSQSQQSAARQSNSRAYYHGNGGSGRRHHDNGNHYGWYKHHGHHGHHGEDCN